MGAERASSQTAARCDGYLRHVLAGATAVTCRDRTGGSATRTRSRRARARCCAWRRRRTGARASCAAVLATGNHGAVAPARLANKCLLARIAAGVRSQAHRRCARRATRRPRSTPCCSKATATSWLFAREGTAAKGGPAADRLAVQGVAAGAALAAGGQRLAVRSTAGARARKTADERSAEREHGGSGRPVDARWGQRSWTSHAQPKNGAVLPTNGSRRAPEAGRAATTRHPGHLPPKEKR